MIIYPPFIGETIPGFTTDKIKIPFQCNPAVDIGEIKTFRLRIKSLINSTIIGVLDVHNNNDYVEYTPGTQNGVITFETDRFNIDLTISQYYKFQLCASDKQIPTSPGSDYKAYDDSFYAYSQVAIGRCLNSVVEFDIEEFKNKTGLQMAQLEYTGYYARPVNNESLYSYQFELMSADGEVLEDSEIQYWNTDNDVSEINDNQQYCVVSRPKFTLHYQLEYNTKYKIRFSITTVNGYSNSVEYDIIKETEYMSFFTGQLKAQYGEDEINNGYILIKPVGKIINGKFVLERTKDKIHWDRLAEFEMGEGGYLEDYYYEDYAVEPGSWYIYGLRQYAENTTTKEKTYSKHILSNKVLVDGEDMFLADEKRQLRIRFNPKISSFKDTILEQKTDTIGGKYPFFFRNNKVKYKEIGISGLISYHMDEQEQFMTKQELNITEQAEDNPKTTNLVGYNVAAERIFREAVIEWLENGEPKLFRSPTEGTYLIRLMNVSVTPEETLGRMLYNFSATGYEIDNHNYETLVKYGVIRENEMKAKERSKLITWPTNNNKNIRLWSNIKNLVWKDSHPNKNSYLQLRETSTNSWKSYYNPRGDFLTIPNKMYHLRADTLSPTSILHFEKIDKSEYQEKYDRFYNMLNNYENLQTKWITIEADSQIPKFLQIHTIIAQHDINRAASSWITLVYDRGYEVDENGFYVKDEDGNIKPPYETEETYDLSHGGIREFNDLNDVIDIDIAPIYTKDKQGNIVQKNNGIILTMLVTTGELKK